MLYVATTQTDASELLKRSRMAWLEGTREDREPVYWLLEAREQVKNLRQCVSETASNISSACGALK